MPYTREETMYIWLASIDGVGPVTFSSLLSVFGTPEGVFERAPKEPKALESVPRFGKALAKALIDSCNEAYIEKFFANMEKKGITAVCRLSPEYPKRLLEVFAPPLVLYCKGRRELLAEEKAVAVIGTRQPTPYGREVAEKVGRALAENGVCVVSGMARGIDVSAHLGALGAGRGATVAVLGNGTDIAYPAEKSYIYDQICREGLVLSEYIPGTRPAAGNFPARNRIISGLAKGVVVVEAGEKSGTNITVNYALEQGKDVFAVPGSIMSKTSFSTNLLIKSGCEVITSEEDVLEFYGWGGREKKRQSAKVKAVPAVQLSFQERMLTDALEAGEKSFDELYEVSQFSLPELFTLLAELELKGIVEQKPGRVYAMSGRPA